MPQNQIQLGWIPYWNLLPMFRELQRIGGGQIKVSSGHPSSVSRWLTEGVVHLAPASSIALIKSRNLEMAMPLGIASDGPVLSVYIGLQREHESFYEFIKSRLRLLREMNHEAQSLHFGDARRQSRFLWSQVKNDRPALSVPELKLSSASMASVALTKVLMNLWLGKESADLMLRMSANSKIDGSTSESGLRPMELVIGDEALMRRHEFWKIIDLGKAWSDLTDLPFVFGLWQTNHQSLPATTKGLLWEAASIAQARMKVEPQIYFPDNQPLAGDGAPVDLAEYWKVIQYKLGDRHLRSLLYYYALYHEISSDQELDWVSERFVRWSQSWQAASSVSH